MLRRGAPRANQAAFAVHSTPASWESRSWPSTTKPRTSSRTRPVPFGRPSTLRRHVAIRVRRFVLISRPRMDSP